MSEATPSLKPPLHPVVRAMRPALIGGGYVLSFWLLHLLSQPYWTAQQISPWYPAPALTLMLLFRAGRRYLPWVFVAALLVALQSDGAAYGWLPVGLEACVSLLSYGGAAVLLLDWVGINPQLRSLADVLWLILIAMIGAPFLAALGTISILVFVSVLPPADFPMALMTYWIGDAVGIVTLLPFLMLHTPTSLHHWRSWRWLRLSTDVAVQLSVALLVVIFSLVLQQVAGFNSFYLCVLPLMWVAAVGDLRRTSSLIMLLNALIFTGCLLWGEIDSWISLQLLLLSISLAALVVSALLQERSYLEQSLQDKERFFRSLITFSSDMLSILDSEGRVIYESPSVRALLGYTNGLVGQNVFVFVHPADLPSVQATYMAHASQPGVSPVVQYRFRHANGSWRWLESVATNVADQPVGGIIVNSRDITERRQVEEQIRFQANLLDQVNNAVVVVDPTLMIMFWNRAAEVLYGWGAGEVLGRSITELNLVDPLEVQAILDHQPQFRWSNASWQGELSILDRQRNAHSIYLTTTVLRSDLGQMQAIVGVANDISPLKIAEQRLIESEQYFRSLIENASDLISILDERGFILYHSPAIERVLGYKTGLVGVNAFDYIHPDDRMSMQMALQRKINQIKVGAPVQYRFRHADGSWRTIESVSNILEARSPDEDGLRIVLNSRDVTERKQLEEALMFVAQGVAGTSDREFYQTLVLYLSRALQVDYAYVGLFDLQQQTVTTLSACEGGHVVENFSYALAETPAERVAQGVTAVYRAEVQRVFPNDPALMALEVESYLALPLFDAEEHVIGILSVMHRQSMNNVALSMSLLSIFAQRLASELKRKSLEEQRLRMERKLMETQKLESLGLLAGGIAHDFNNVLTTILGNVGLAQLEFQSDPLLATYLETIETASRHAADLCRQMLAYSGRGRMQADAIQVNSLVQEMSNLLQVSIGKHIELQCHFAPDLPMIEGDISQIRQVVMNLIVNAAEAINEHKQGMIELTTGLITVDRLDLENLAGAAGVEPGPYVFVSVSDNGAGMDAETQAKIFDPFFTTKFTGRGLGLAAVQGIVRAHGGWLNVYSELGIGSTFKLFLPCSAVVADQAEPQPVEPALAAGGTILIIDDEAPIRTTVSGMVAALGFSALQASSGAEGLRMLQERHAAIAAVLLDLTMPLMNGEETMRQLRLIDRQVPVILMSGYSQTETVSRFNGQGLAGFLQKPFTISELRALLVQATALRPG